ncbi:PREDICTED: putative RNA-binding protein 15B [Cyprinodon variegatus]|uniref:putative RNA-binding protein 15B n=1 Tax=Cyprinodon variegatus TaxID=28743 RepID=UPI00074285FC|nr:PREDICTED: putative RNA-binding protein 15B [Cyprinodon variegatus]
MAGKGKYLPSPHKRSSRGLTQGRSRGLTQRLDEVMRRIKLGRPDGFAILLALQGPVDRQPPGLKPGLQVRLLQHLVTYLRNKEAAGVVSLPAAKESGPGAMLYAFPSGEFSQQFLQAAKRTVGSLDEEHMVIVIVNDTN